MAPPTELALPDATSVRARPARHCAEAVLAHDDSAERDVRAHTRVAWHARGGLVILRAAACATPDRSASGHVRPVRARGRLSRSPVFRPYMEHGPCSAPVPMPTEFALEPERGPAERRVDAPRCSAMPRNLMPERISERTWRAVRGAARGGSAPQSMQCARCSTDLQSPLTRHAPDCSGGVWKFHSRNACLPRRNFIPCAAFLRST